MDGEHYAASSELIGLRQSTRKLHCLTKHGVDISWGVTLEEGESKPDPHGHIPWR